MKLFLYGTLRDPVLFNTLVGATCVFEDATLTGYCVERAEGATTPMIVARDGAEAKGVLVEVTDEQLSRVDAYETPWGYQRVMVSLDGREVGLYLPPEDQVSSGEAWDFDQWFAAEGAIDRSAMAEIVSNEHPLTAEELIQQWKMIRHRAWAAHRASAPAPATLRRSAGFAAVKRLIRLSGSFFKFRQVELQHETFSGGKSAVLPREGFHGCDASLVLPYDPVTDRILLVEQFRVGPFLRQDSNPWMLEPIAGMIDAGETPEEAGRREAEEEAGLTLTDLLPMFGGYSTPGNASEFHYSYLALTSLPEEQSYLGGLEEEGEDLRPHILPFDTALEMVRSGEICVMPLIAMLFWLQTQRSQLREAA